jgi:pimeloyl-ACP methyl ester carboxylesterase
MKLDYIMCASQEGFHKTTYSEWGYDDKQDTAVLCVHGLTRNRHDFDPLAQSLSAEGHHVFCPDIVGRGDSDWFRNSKHYNYQQYLMDMNNLIARTGAQRIDWIGTSMGGLIGMILASLPHTPIRSLILNDIGPQLPVQALERLNQYVGRKAQFGNLTEAKDYFKTIYSAFGSLTEEQWDFITQHSIQEQPSGVYVPKLDPNIKTTKPGTQLLKELFVNPHRALEGIFFDIDLWYLWRNVRCPVLVIHGENSDLLLPEYIKQMQRNHSDVTVLEVANAGHAPILFHPQEHEEIAHWLWRVQNGEK